MWEIKFWSSNFNKRAHCVGGGNRTCPLATWSGRGRRGRRRRCAVRLSRARRGAASVGRSRFAVRGRAASRPRRSSRTLRSMSCAHRAEVLTRATCAPRVRSCALRARRFRPVPACAALVRATVLCVRCDRAVRRPYATVGQHRGHRSCTPCIPCQSALSCPFQRPLCMRSACYLPC